MTMKSARPIFSKKALVILLCFSMLLGVVVAPDLSNFTVNAETTNSMPMGFEGHTTLAEMMSANLLDYTNKSGVAAYSLNTNFLYAQNGNNSLKLSFLQTSSSDYTSRFRILLKQTITEADGISFWIYNPGNLAVNSYVFAGLTTNSTVRYKYYGYTSVVFPANMNGFQKVTLRFDGFGLRSTNDGGAIYANTAPTKDTVATFDYIELRVYSTKANQSIYLDSFDWVYDRDITTFDDSNELPSNVTVKGFLNQTESNFYTYSIINSGADTGKALKVDFGTVDGETVETTNELNVAYRYIQVSINTNGMNVNGDALRAWLKNTSAADIGVRLRITDAEGVQHRHKSGNYKAVLATGNVNNMILQSDYSVYKEYSPIFNYVNETKPASLLADSQLQNAQKIELFIFPRSVNNGGSLIIDGISIVNPTVTKSDNKRLLNFDNNSMPEGVTVSKSYYSEGTYGIVSHVADTNLLQLDFNATPTYTGQRYNESSYYIKIPVNQEDLSGATDLQMGLTNNGNSAVRFTVAFKCQNGGTTYYCKYGQNESATIPANSTTTFTSLFSQFRKTTNEPHYWVGASATMATTEDILKAVELQLIVYLPETVDISKDSFQIHYVDRNPTTMYSATSDSSITNGTVGVDGGILTAGRGVAGNTANVTVTPNSGYQLKVGSLIVKDINGNAIAVPTRSGFRKNSMADTYEFTMPAQDVTVYAEFVSTVTAQPNIGAVGRSVNNDLSGLRFVFRMGKKPDETIMVNGIAYQIQSYGALITSQQILNAKSAARSELTLGVFSDTNSVLYSARNKIVNVDIAKTGIKYDECAQYVDFSICIVHLSTDAMKNAAIVARPYVIYSDGTSNIVYYLDAVASSYNAYTTVIPE